SFPEDCATSAAAKAAGKHVPDGCALCPMCSHSNAPMATPLVNAACPGEVRRLSPITDAIGVAPIDFAWFSTICAGSCSLPTKAHAIQSSKYVFSRATTELGMRSNVVLVANSASCRVGPASADIQAAYTRCVPLKDDRGARGG